MTVASPFAAWLKADAYYASALGSTAWGTRAIAQSASSPLVFTSDATAEAQRQIAFLGGPLVTDEHVVPGRHADLIGRVITITADRLGYEGGLDVFVIEADEITRDGATVLTVLRRMSA